MSVFSIVFGWLICICNLLYVSVRKQYWFFKNLGLISICLKVLFSFYTVKDNNI